ncbi:MAG: sigma factor-like helix-turn-helix DNA-binding protein [Oscillospiraceae bacterium]
MDKNLDVAVLLDFYGEMLTQKQRNVIDLYYNQDLSLSEIAQHEQITRQGVRDSIKRGEVLLFEMEQKLQMLKLHKKTLAVITKIRYSIERIEKENSTFNYSSRLTDEINSINHEINSYMDEIL